MTVSWKCLFSSHFEARQNKNVLSWRLKQLGLVSWRMFSNGRAFHACGPA